MLKDVTKDVTKDVIHVLRNAQEHLIELSNKLGDCIKKNVTALREKLMIVSDEFKNNAASFLKNKFEKLSPFIEIIIDTATEIFNGKFKLFLNLFLK